MNYICYKSKNDFEFVDVISVLNKWTQEVVPKKNVKQDTKVSGESRNLRGEGAMCGCHNFKKTHEIEKKLVEGGLGGACRQ